MMVMLLLQSASIHQIYRIFICIIYLHAAAITTHHSTDSRERPNEMESLAAFELWIGLLACGVLRTKK
jgi:hypothetical protein